MYVPDKALRDLLNQTTGACGAMGTAAQSDHPTRLEHVLADEGLAIAFRNFLHKAACSENLSFWLEVELLKELDENEQKSILTSAANKVFEKYFTPNSQYEVNVDQDIRLNLQKDMASPTIHSFDIAQDYARMLLETDCLPKFTRSDVWKQYQEERKKNPRPESNGAAVVTSLTKFLRLLGVKNENEPRDIRCERSATLMLMNDWRHFKDDDSPAKPASKREKLKGSDISPEFRSSDPKDGDTKRLAVPTSRSPSVSPRGAGTTSASSSSASISPRRSLEIPQRQAALRRSGDATLLAQLVAVARRPSDPPAYQAERLPRKTSSPSVSSAVNLDAVANKQRSPSDGPAPMPTTAVPQRPGFISSYTPSNSSAAFSSPLSSLSSPSVSSQALPPTPPSGALVTPAMLVHAPSSNILRPLTKPAPAVPAKSGQRLSAGTTDAPIGSTLAAETATKLRRSPSDGPSPASADKVEPIQLQLIPAPKEHTSRSTTPALEDSHVGSEDNTDAPISPRGEGERPPVPTRPKPLSRHKREQLEATARAEKEQQQKVAADAQAQQKAEPEAGGLTESIKAKLGTLRRDKSADEKEAAAKVKREKRMARAEQGAKRDHPAVAGLEIASDEEEQKPPAVLSPKGMVALVKSVSHKVIQRTSSGDDKQTAERAAAATAAEKEKEKERTPSPDSASDKPKSLTSSDKRPTVDVSPNVPKKGLSDSDKGKAAERRGSEANVEDGRARGMSDRLLTSIRNTLGLEEKGGVDKEKDEKEKEAEEKKEKKEKDEKDPHEMKDKKKDKKHHHEKKEKKHVHKEHGGDEKEKEKENHGALPETKEGDIAVTDANKDKDKEREKSADEMSPLSPRRLLGTVQSFVFRRDVKGTDIVISKPSAKPTPTAEPAATTSDPALVAAATNPTMTAPAAAGSSTASSSSSPSASGIPFLPPTAIVLGPLPPMLIEPPPLLQEPAGPPRPPSSDNFPPPKQDAVAT